MYRSNSFTNSPRSYSEREYEYTTEYTRTPEYAPRRSLTLARDAPSSRRSYVRSDTIVRGEPIVYRPPVSELVRYYDGGAPGNNSGEYFEKTMTATRENKSRGIEEKREVTVSSNGIEREKLIQSIGNEKKVTTWPHSAEEGYQTYGSQRDFDDRFSREAQYLPPFPEGRVADGARFHKLSTLEDVSVRKQDFEHLYSLPSPAFSCGDSGISPGSEYRRDYRREETHLTREPDDRYWKPLSERPPIVYSTGRSCDPSPSPRSRNYEYYDYAIYRPMDSKRVSLERPKTYVPQYKEGDPTTNYAIGPNAFGGVTGYENKSKTIRYEFLDRGTLPDAPENAAMPPLNQMPLHPDNRIHPDSIAPEVNRESWRRYKSPRKERKYRDETTRIHTSYGRCRREDERDHAYESDQYYSRRDEARNSRKERPSSVFCCTSWC